MCEEVIEKLFFWIEGRSVYLVNLSRSLHWDLALSAFADDLISRDWRSLSVLDLTHNSLHG
jgi:hypothetical protein